MKTVLVVANETLGGLGLLEKARELAAEEGGLRVIVCVPRSRPRHGNVIYDDAVFQAAQTRIDLARQVLRSEGIDAVGEVGDPDPYTATMDAILEHDPDEVIVSTFPTTTSGWLRRDLVERIADAAGRPVHHIVSDIDAEGLPFEVTLVVANRTASTPELLAALRERAGDEPHRHLFIAVVPQEGGEGVDAPARRRAAGPARRPHARRRPVRGRDDRAAGPLRRDDERRAVLPRRRHRDLDAARDPLGLAAGRPRSSGCARRRASRSSTSSPSRPPRRPPSPWRPAPSGRAGPRSATPTTTSTTGRRRRTAARGSTPSSSG